VQRVFFNPITNPENEGLTDATPRELAVLVPLIAAMVWMGLYPQPILRRTEAAARKYVETIRPYIQAPGTAGTASVAEAE